MSSPGTRSATGLRVRVAAWAGRLAILLLMLMAAWNAGMRVAPGWTADDGAHLRFSALYPVMRYLGDAELLRAASGANLTPLLNVFYSANLGLFGMDPAPWRMMVALLSALVAGAFYLASRQTMRPSLALAMTWVWIWGVPFFYVAATFMTAHYLLGMGAALLSLWTYTRWMRGGAAAWLLAATACYALAIFAKEVYAPLPALLLLQAPWRKTLRGMLPLALVAGIYLACRHVVLGTVVGGYRHGDYLAGVGGVELLQRVLHLPVIMLGGSVPALLTGLVCLLLFGWLGKPVRHLTLAAVALGVVLLPLLPLVAAADLVEPDRYFLVAATVGTFLLGCLLEAAWRQGREFAVKAIALVAMAAATVQHIAHVPGLVAGLERQSALYRHVLGTDGPMLLLNPGLPADDRYWSGVLNAAREARARKQGKPHYAEVRMTGHADAPVVIDLRRRGVPLYRWEAGSRRFVEQAPPTTDKLPDPAGAASSAHPPFSTLIETPRT